MKKADAIIVGGGPCGLAAAISLQNIGLSPVIIEKGNVVEAIYNYPTHQTFFSTSEKLAIGDVPFIIEGRKPKRNQALVYYREVVKLKKLQVNRFETVERVEKKQDFFVVNTSKGVYHAKVVVIATGYYDHPNLLGIPGEELPKVSHYFKEGHTYFDTDVVVIGGKNSSIDAALELHKAGARVTVVYRGSTYSSSIKPWILPEFEGVVKNGEITMLFESHVEEIKQEEVIIRQQNQVISLKNDFVFAMIGYHPDHEFLREMGVRIDEESGRPLLNELTMESNIENLYIAGVLAAGNNANEIFIENGRFHGELIADAIVQKEKLLK
ncbi:YpdA family putative bacillithiol disulfide reductase [Paenisporosarcina sp. OV554]|uniref:YpdA family putative bacillithiol disulfide reductase n=1 Tax=Paenisporosarcina sp. OV554 TaxID=2135694 RepID=UPI000D3A6A76|nr:YpdA family putative bacillithiol disulfide reductase [Paenisporosarcina sp. OV554]PUB10353.1 thioredoxin reductase (NADPH) [Paenisporosarcina sp. OV554]